jgi:hypothetical protein
MSLLARLLLTARNPRAWLEAVKKLPIKDRAAAVIDSLRKRTVGAPVSGAVATDTIKQGARSWWWDQLKSAAVYTLAGGAFKVVYSAVAGAADGADVGAVEKTLKEDHAVLRELENLKFASDEEATAVAAEVQKALDSTNMALLAFGFTQSRALLGRLVTEVFGDLEEKGATIDTNWVDTMGEIADNGGMSFAEIEAALVDMSDKLSMSARGVASLIVRMDKLLRFSAQNPGVLAEFAASRTEFWSSFNRNKKGG